MTAHLLPKARSDVLMQAMSGYPCALRVSSFYPGHTCASAATVVGCHVGSFGKGVGTKVTDLAVVAGCQNCHDIIDGRDKKRQDWIINHYPTAYVDRLLNGLIETHARLYSEGIILVQGDKR